MNMFAQITQPAVVRSVRLVAASDIRRIRVTPLHVSEGNDFELLLVDAATRKTYYQSPTPVRDAVEIDIPHPGEFDLLAVYHTNDTVKAQLQRDPVQMTVSGQELVMPDDELPILQIAGFNVPTDIYNEIQVKLYIERNAEVKVLLDGAAYEHVRGHEAPSGTYNLFINHERMVEGPHKLTILTRKPGSANQTIVNREFLINRQDSFSDVPQKKYWQKKKSFRLICRYILVGNQGSNW